MEGNSGPLVEREREGNRVSKFASVIKVVEYYDPKCLPSMAGVPITNDIVLVFILDTHTK